MEEIEGMKVIYHVVMDANRFGLTAKDAQMMDMADEYAVVEHQQANGGVIVWGKYKRQGWVVNPSARFLIRDLLEKLGCYPTNKQTE